MGIGDVVANCALLLIAKGSREYLGLTAAEITLHLDVNTSSITRGIERTE